MLHGHPGGLWPLLSADDSITVATAKMEVFPTIRHGDYNGPTYLPYIVLHDPEDTGLPQFFLYEISEHK